MWNELLKNRKNIILVKSVLDFSGTIVYNLK